jgi:hypothetical protein
MQGKDVIYANKGAAEQLRKLNRISVVDMHCEASDGLYEVTVKVQDDKGRSDIATGIVNLKGKRKNPTTGAYEEYELKGDELANQKMKCCTKAKRRATLSICGLGILDESELETIKFVNDDDRIAPQAQLDAPLTAQYIEPFIDSCKTKDELTALYKANSSKVTDEILDLFKAKTKELAGGAPKLTAAEKAKILKTEADVPL